MSQPLQVPSTEVRPVCGHGQAEFPPDLKALHFGLFVFLLDLSWLKAFALRPFGKTY